MVLGHRTKEGEGWTRMRIHEACIHRVMHRVEKKEIGEPGERFLGCGWTTGLIGSDNWVHN